MSAETDYLASWFHIRPSMTATSAQGPKYPHAPNWNVGITGFAWSNLGSHVGQPPVGLSFQTLVWFSDRIVNPGVTPQDQQRFSAAAYDEERRVFTLNGDHVHLHTTLLTWGNATWDADSFMFDPSSQQLLFHVPGAGATAPPAIMAVSFGQGAGIL
jgi:hypothetical protein